VQHYLALSREKLHGLWSGRVWRCFVQHYLALGREKLHGL
jgi:hypothetical protein